MTITIGAALAAAAGHAREHGLLLPVRCRWVIRRDMPEVTAIERASFADPWTEDDIACRLRGRNVIGMVAEHGETVAGYMVYELGRNSIYLVRLAVHPACRRVRVGYQMMFKLAAKVKTHRREKLVVAVPESMLEAQLFFKAMGFRTTKVVHGRHGGEDTYRMVWRVGGEE